jgi:hypothetical protein
MQEITSWIEDHPYATGGIVIVGGLALLWLFGFFGSSSTASADTSGNNLAAAYYSAEAAQATAGTQLQMATVAYGNQTAQVQAQANAAEAIASTQANMYTTLGSQTSSTAQLMYNDQLLSSQTNANDALNAANTNANYQYLTSVAGDQAQQYGDYAGMIIPSENAAYAAYLQSPFAGGAQTGEGPSAFRTVLPPV